MQKFILIIVFLGCIRSYLYAQKNTRGAPASSISKRNVRRKVIKYGIASFYSAKFNGRRTANGEIYNDRKYTAACNVLPLNTWIKVTNLRNNRSVVVKVNDRMHPKNKRLVDLSKIAAKELGYAGRGLTKVKIEVIKHH